MQNLVAKGYVRPGVYGSLSIKSELLNHFGEQEQILWMAGPQEAHFDNPESVPGLCLTGLRRLLDLDNLSGSELKNELHRARTRASDPIPAWESLLHACFPERCVIHSCPPALLAIACSKARKNRLRALFGTSLELIEFSPPGFQIARQLARSTQASSQDLNAFYMVGYGLWISGPNAEACCNLVEALEMKAKSYLQEQGAWDIKLPRPAQLKRPVRNHLASLRKVISEKLGKPAILNMDMGFSKTGLSRWLEGKHHNSLKPPTLYHAIYTGFPEMLEWDLTSLNKVDYEYSSLENRRGLYPPRVIVDKEVGVCFVGNTASEVYRTVSSFHSATQAWSRAGRLGDYQPFPLQRPGVADQIPLSTAERTELSLFSGEIALVTGGASGIGKACVESLLKRGAAVASMDINPAVVKMYETPDYLGLQCDLTDEGAVMQAFEALARHFGGLDMLVLNAGIFPPGIRIESLDLAHWQKVMNINMNSNLIVLREAYPLLRLSPNGGRVLVNGSKNVLAPGAGAAAYSSSKAAVTQLARVAALEWGKDRIRVNMIHADGVFDTGIWTEEVLQTRAAHYGMSVQQYKTRNLLGVELNSHDIGELAAEMLGPLFEKITGAQIPVDGGSDRVI
jgi:NAD(P)-dependent dehydrogenase (short-subunit alcohol dehydrogenase family)/rhamnose utilization protein RhaD (predicted bifunctional aldolase and dehydrogenase)